MFLSLALWPWMNEVQTKTESVFRNSQTGSYHLLAITSDNLWVLMASMTKIFTMDSTVRSFRLDSKLTELEWDHQRGHHLQTGPVTSIDADTVAGAKNAYNWRSFRFIDHDDHWRRLEWALWAALATTGRRNAKNQTRNHQQQFWWTTREGHLRLHVYLDWR